MKFIHRLAYYLGGFSLGMVILAFFLTGKKTSCAYSPNARVLKNLRIKEKSYSAAVLENMRRYQIDSTDISQVLKSGNVNFKRSNTDLDSCKTYWVSGTSVEKSIEVLLENCDSVATILELKIVE